MMTLLAGWLAGSPCGRLANEDYNDDDQWDEIADETLKKTTEDEDLIKELHNEDDDHRENYYQSSNTEEFFEIGLEEEEDSSVLNKICALSDKWK